MQHSNVGRDFNARKYHEFVADDVVYRQTDETYAVHYQLPLYRVLDYQYIYLGRSQVMISKESSVGQSPLYAIVKPSMHWNEHNKYKCIIINIDS